MNIQKIINSKTEKIGKKIEYYKQITSTHQISKQKAKKFENNGTIIIAEQQTQGIGTKGRSWYTGEENNIAMTIIIKPKCTIDKIEGITIKIAELIKQSVKELYTYDLEIKYPNDLLLNGKKICGILTQVATISERIDYLLISIGFNVNEINFSEETIKLATSLKKEYGKIFSREDIIIKFIEKLEKYLVSKNIM